MAEGFGPPPASSDQASIDNLPTRDIPALPLSNPLRETLGSDFSLGQCEVSDQEVAITALEYDIDQTTYQVFTTPVVDRMSMFFIPIPIAHFQV